MAMHADDTWDGTSGHQTIQTKGTAKTINSVACTVHERNSTGEILYVTLGAAATGFDGEIGFAHGCFAMDTANNVSYINVGSAASANFDQLAVGSAVAPTNVTPVDSADDNAEFYPLIADGATGSQAVETDAEWTINPSTNIQTFRGCIGEAGQDFTIVPVAGQAVLIDGAVSVDAGVITGATSITSTVFVGDITGNVIGNVTGNVVGNVTGDVTGNASTATTAGTVTTAAQPNITSLGTLSTVTVDNLTINGNTINAGAGAINITPAAGSAIVLDGIINVDAGAVTGATSITSTAFVGDVTGNCSGTAATVTGAAQAAITSLGTLTTLTVDNLTVNGNTIQSDSGTMIIGTDATGAGINIVPATGSSILLDGAINIDAGIITGATSITSTTFVGDVTGNCSGTAATVTGAAQANITSVGTLTALDVDDVNINGSTISEDTGGLTLSSSAGAININPNAGSAIVLDGTISVDAGVVTGASSITSTAFVGGISGGTLAGTTLTLSDTATMNGNVGLGSAQDDTITCNGRLVLRTANEADPDTSTAGTEGEIVYNLNDNKLWFCTVTGGAGAATWEAVTSA